MFDNEAKKTETIKNLRRRTCRLDRQGEYWSEDERKQLRDLFDEGVGITEISIILQQSEIAVWQQILKMDLYNSHEHPLRTSRGFRPPVCLCDACQLDRNACPRCIHEHNGEEAE